MRTDRRMGPSALTHSQRHASQAEHGPRLHRDLGVDVRGVARRVLSGGARAEAGAGVRGGDDGFRGDQRVLLLAPAPHQLPKVVRGDAGGLRLRRQGEPLHHPHAQAEEPRDGARQLSRFRRAAAGGEAGAHAVAVPGADAVQRGAVRALPGPPPPHPRRGGRVRARPRRPPAGPRVDGCGARRPHSPRVRDPPSRLSHGPLSGPAARARRALVFADTAGRWRTRKT